MTWWQTVDWGLVFDEGLLLTVATLKLLLWLTLRRRTAVGRAISASMLAMAILYYSAAAGLHLDWFRSDAWRVFIRVLVAGTTGYALWALVGHFGGWRATWREVCRGAGDVWGGCVETGALLAWRARRAGRWFRGS